MTTENRKPRLNRLDRIFVRAPIYFITACAHNRPDVIANAAVHQSFLCFVNQGPQHGAWVGTYALTPDHLHAFIAIDDEKLSLSTWAKSLKNAVSKTLRREG